ncbi:sterol desaturase family protein [Chondromyces apiculatus]|uniref:Sterol desaturase family protein n=1 Tax=Chondromyces apiculatus DSM 436 TaxID=1192034 RepID=A0A017SWM0_9BACT|nr:sterol desaturase family protein [Chondromyces apiculatus]EYF01147.1 sterol desaturase family protein [Chondromyces apiculatus DSM 436]
MNALYIALAVPFFVVLIGAEMLVNRRQGDLRYTFHDTITSMSCGSGQQVIGLLMAAVGFGGYAFVYEHFRVATLSPSAPFAWLVLLFGVDLGYYVYHWASHRISFFWATHIVHHQSEEYNLSTALRQSWFTGFTSWIFYLPLAVVGFPPLMFLAMTTLNTLYQFWIHTRAVGKLGWLESVLNTPSHHRVHHGINPRYIDKNYAGIFILWDRMFGTFTAEVDEPVYGTVKPLRSFNPLWANVEHLAELLHRSRRTRRLRDKLLVWVMPPEWMPADLGGPVTVPEVSREAQRKYAVVVPRGLNLYGALGFAGMVAATTLLLWGAARMSFAELSWGAGVVLLGTATWGGLVEAKSWAVPLEWARLAAAAGLVVWLAQGTSTFAVASAGAVAVALGLSLWVGRYLRRRVSEAPALVSAS